MEDEADDKILVFRLEGRVDSSNAGKVEQDLKHAIERSDAAHVRLDASELDYISSAGLRVIMRILKSGKEVSVVEASAGVYDIFDTTGFTSFMDVRRAPKQIDTTGLQQIGAGAFGRVFRIDSERVAKLYDARVYSTEKVEIEREVARKAFIHDIPSAIPFETVRSRSTNEYGVIYELVDARTIGEVVATNPQECEAWATRMAQLATKLHTTTFEDGVLPDARLIFHQWVDRAEAGGIYDPSIIAQLREFVDTIPVAQTFVHGDLHPANIMVLSNDELVLIDMGDAAQGHPVIDLAGAYHVMRVAARRPGGAERLCGMPLELLDKFWATFVRTYFCEDNEQRIAQLERALAFAALPRTMGSNARSKLIDDQQRRRKAVELEQRFLAGCDSLRWESLVPSNQP